MKYHTIPIYVILGIFLMTVSVYADPVLIDCVLAVVDQDVITMSDLMLREKGLYGSEKASQDLSPEAREMFRERILQDLIDERLLIKEAQRMKLIPSDAEVEERIEAVRKGNENLSRDSMEASLAKDGLTMDDLKKNISEDISLLMIRHQIAYRGVQVSDQEVLDYYSKEWTGYKEGVRVKLHHILFKKDSGKPDPEQEKEVLEEYEKIKRQTAQGMPFPELSSKYAHDVQGTEGGYLGKFYTKDLRPEFAEAVQGLHADEISRPVKTELGYHILFVEEKADSGLDKDSPIWKKIEETLIEKKKANQYDAWISRIRKDAAIETNKDVLKKVFLQ